MGLVIGDHRAGHAQLLAARARVSRGRRLARGRRPGVRRGVVVPADRRACGRFRADDRDLDRGGRQRADRLRPALAPARIPTALACVVAGRGADLVRARRAAGLRRHDGPVHRRVGIRCWRSAGLARHEAHGHAPITGSASPALVAVILAFPVAMALATGTEAPATLDRPARAARRRGRGASARERSR